MSTTYPILQIQQTYKQPIKANMAAIDIFLGELCDCYDSVCVIGYDDGEQLMKAVSQLKTNDKLQVYIQLVTAYDNENGSVDTVSMDVMRTNDAYKVYVEDADYTDLADTLAEAINKSQ